MGPFTIKEGSVINRTYMFMFVSAQRPFLLDLVTGLETFLFASLHRFTALLFFSYTRCYTSLVIHKGSPVAFHFQQSPTLWGPLGGRCESDEDFAEESC